MSFPASIKDSLRKELKGELVFDEPLARYTTVKIGGRADGLFYPADPEDLSRAIKLCKARGVSYFVLGNGSNLLIRDGGIRGLVIRLNRCLNNFKQEGQTEDGEVLLVVEAGVPLPKLVEFSRQNGLSGLESLYGIPGTVGGALVMNAGTREGEIGPRVVDLTVMESSGEIKTYPEKRLDFEYRALKIPRSEVILRVTLRLSPAEPEKVAERIGFFQRRRHETQPLDQANMGSVFKNPPKRFAAQLIEELGLKGVRVGGARISE